MNLASKRLGQICTRVVTRAFSSTMGAPLSGDNLGYVERMYEAWKQDPRSVHISWNEYFKNAVAGSGKFEAGKTAGAMSASSAKDIEDHVKIMQLVYAYQLKGHELADLDPLRNIKSPC